MSNHHPSLGYEPVMTPRGRVARITCAAAGCSTQEEISIRAGHNPEAVAKEFRRRGWKADVQTASKARCPACVTAKAPHDPDELLRQHQARQEQQEETMATIAPPSKTALTVDDKRRIRHLLDANFDDAQGAYLAGYSDQRIGAELGLPWALVSEYRDQTYGPIKIDPDVQAAKEMLIQIDQAIQTLRRDVDAMVAVIRKDMETASARIAAATAKRKTAA